MTGGSNVTSIALTKYWTPRSSKGSSGGGPDVRLFRGNGGVGLVVGAVADVGSARSRSCSLSGCCPKGGCCPPPCCVVLLRSTWRQGDGYKKTRHEWTLKHRLTPGATIHRGSIDRTKQYNRIHGKVDSTKHQEQPKQCIFVIFSVNVLLL